MKQMNPGAFLAKIRRRFWRTQICLAERPQTACTTGS
jgi:hypothetical protein